MKQITLIYDNHPGLLAEITEELGQQGINIETLDAESFKDTAVTILTVDRYDEALDILSSKPGLQAITEEAILIRLEDRPGALAKVARKFSDAGINLRSIRIIKRDADDTVVAISAERTDEALELVRDQLIS
ncbi:MAG: ACT domain-containing protein [Gammaproteobacteria bacterium]|nr:ACT domain-containing protein [Gammaproteobacteria bacterium]